MSPFARGGGGGAYSRGQKQFYQPPPPPPPPPPPIPAGPSRQSRYEVLMEAGRLAAEYLVAKGVLPAASLQRGGGGVGTVGWGQMPPPPPLPQAPEAPGFYDSRRNGRRRLDDEQSSPNPRSRRNHGGDYSDSNNSDYNGRGKRKFGAYNRNSQWGRDRERNRGYSDSRNYDDGEEEDGAPGYKRDRRGGGVIDEVGSSVSGVAGEGQASKVEAVGESELEDTGSKVSSSSNVRKDADAVQEVQDDNETNKMQEDCKVSNSEVAVQGRNDESISNNASSGIVEEMEITHPPVPSDDNVSDEKHDDTTVMDEKAEDDTTLDEKDDKASDAKMSSVENNLGDDCKNLLNYCSFARAPTRPRSILGHRNGAPAHRQTSLAEQADLVPVMAIDEQVNDSTLAVQGDSKNGLVCLEHTGPSVACDQMVEQVRLQENVTQDGVEHSTSQDCAVQEIKEHNGLSATLASHHIREGVQIYNIDTPPEDESFIDSADKGKTVSVELLPNRGVEAVGTMEDEKLDQSSSFKIRDLNLIGSPELAEIRNDPGLGQCSNIVCSSSMDAQNQQHLDFQAVVGNTTSHTDRYAQIPLDNKVVQVIDIEDDSPIEPSACDTSRAKSEMVYSNMDNMIDPTVNTSILPGMQDGYNLAIPDFLGADMPCYPPIQTDLHAEMGLNGSEVITVMDDPIYGSLSDIGFMEVWDQQPPDYEKFF